MQVETATKLLYAVMALVFTGMGIYFLYRAYTGVGESIWVAIGYLVFGIGWVLLLLRASR